MDTNTHLLQVLTECAEYFGSRMYADCDGVGFIPNQEMRLFSAVEEAIKRLEAQ